MAEKIDDVYEDGSFYATLLPGRTPMLSSMYSVARHLTYKDIVPLSKIKVYEIEYCRNIRWSTLICNFYWANLTNDIVYGFNKYNITNMV